MNCEHVRERLVDLHEGVLAADDAPAVRAHVAECAACRGELAEIEALQGRVTRLAESVAANGPEGDAGAGTMVGELTMLRIGGRRAGSVEAANLRRVVRWGVPLAAAACMCVAVTLWLFVPERASAVTLAQMVEHVRQSKSVAFSVKVTTEGFIANEENEFSARVTVLDGKWGRFDARIPQLGDMVTIQNLENGHGLTLWSSSKTAWRTPSPVKQNGTEHYQSLLDLAKTRGTFIGEETLNGEATKVIRADREALSEGGKPLDKDGTSVREEERRIWIGIASGLPVRVEHTVSGREPNGKTTRIKLVFSDFLFDAPQDPGLFSMEPPAGYTVTEVPAGPMPPPVRTTEPANPTKRDASSALANAKKNFAVWTFANVVPVSRSRDGLPKGCVDDDGQVWVQMTLEFKVYQDSSVPSELAKPVLQATALGGAGGSRLVNLPPASFRLGDLIDPLEHPEPPTPRDDGTPTKVDQMPAKVRAKFVEAWRAWLVANGVKP